MKAKLLSFFCALLMSIGMQAHDLEPLHVDGRYLRNPAGDIVTLHGYMTSLESWFQAEDFKFDNYDFQTATINKKAAIDSVLATGWKMDYVRFIFPDYYCFDKGDGYKGFNLGLFKKYLDEFCLPLIDYFHEKGIYTILLPPTSSPILIGYGDEFQQFLLLLWDCISSHPRIRNNPGIMFELANEPVNFSCKYSNYDGLGSYFLNSRTPFKEVKDYWQPIVDKIRSHCNNIVYVPGMQWQSDFTGFADYPITGENIGYAIHWYPGWWGNMRKDWEEHVYPVAYMAPFVMTETGWGIYEAVEGTTTNFGNPLKEIVDDLGNVSWNCWVAYEDYYYLVNDETSENERATIANDPEVYFKPLYQWWNDYAHTKVMPTNQLKAKSVSFNDFPTTVSPGRYWLAKIKAEFSNGLSWDVSGDAEYTVSDESVLTIKNGVIRAWKEGTVTVGVTYTDGTGQTFSRQFSITSTLFPLTNQGFNPDITTDGNSFDELNGTFSSETWTFGGWTYGERLDLSSYQYLVFQLREPPQYGASVHIWDNDLWWDENGGWSSACDPVSGQPGFDFGGSTELVINLQELKNKSGQPLDLGHIGGVAIFVYSGTVRIKKVFLSNDGTTPAPYVGEPVVVYADNKTIYYGDEVPELTYSVVGNALLQTPTLSTTVTKASTVGMYDISIDGNEDNVHYYPGNLHVIPAPLTVSAGTHSLVEGEMIPVITPIYDGLKNEETEETAFVVKPTTQPMLSGWAIAGSYPIYLNSNGKTNGNYVLDYSQTTGILTVKESEDIKKYGIDLTARVGISQEDWHAWGATDTIYAPAVTTSDGRQAQMMEVWTESPADKTGEIMYQTISGLDNGEYLVGIYANARKNTHIQGFDFEEGANDMVYVAANDVRVYIPAYTEDVLIFGNGVCGIRTKVTDGTLRISMVAEKLGTHWHTIQIKRLVKLTSAEPQDEDLTALVGTSQEAWNAWGVCATEYAPAITTNDGRRAQMMETYEETTETTGEMMHQTVSGLENGDYAIELYANAQYTDGRGFASDLKDGATDVAYVSANDRRYYVTAHIGTAVSENGVYTIYAHVTDGKLRLGLTAEKTGTNWHTIQIRKLTLLRLSTVIYADDKTREQGQDNPEWTYTLSGADVTGHPSLICTANKQSHAGSYVIRVDKGMTNSDQPIYLQNGVLTVTVPSSIEDIFPMVDNLADLNALIDQAYSDLSDAFGEVMRLVDDYEFMEEGIYTEELINAIEHEISNAFKELTTIDSEVNVAEDWTYLLNEEGEVDAWKERLQNLLNRINGTPDADGNLVGGIDQDIEDAENTYLYYHNLGDANIDGLVSTTDYVEIMNYVLMKTEHGEKYGTMPADTSEDQKVREKFSQLNVSAMDGDKKINVTDAVALINLLSYGDIHGAAGARAFDISAQVNAKESMANGVRRIALLLNNSQVMVAGQFDVRLPEGVKLEGAQLASRANGHSLDSNILSNGSVRFVIASKDNTAFEGNEGAVVYIDVEGAGEVLFENIEFVTDNAFGMELELGAQATAINGINADENIEQVYSLTGRLMNTLKQGVNIIRRADGKTEKVIKK